MASLLHAAPPLRHDAGAEDAIRAAVQVLRLTQKDLVQWLSAKDYTPPRRFEAEGWLVAPETVTALECSDRGVDFVLAIIGGNIYRDLFEQLPAKGVGEVEEAVLYVRFADGRVVELRDLPVVDSLVNVVRRRGKA